MGKLLYNDPRCSKAFAEGAQNAHQTMGLSNPHAAGTPEAQAWDAGEGAVNSLGVGSTSYTTTPNAGNVYRVGSTDRLCTSAGTGVAEEDSAAHTLYDGTAIYELLPGDDGLPGLNANGCDLGQAGIILEGLPPLTGNMRVNDNLT